MWGGRTNNGTISANSRGLPDLDSHVSTGDPQTDSAKKRANKKAVARRPFVALENIGARYRE
jgi:hypothetical protein